MIAFGARPSRNPSTRAVNYAALAATMSGGAAVRKGKDADPYGIEDRGSNPLRCWCYPRRQGRRCLGPPRCRNAGRYAQKYRNIADRSETTAATGSSSWDWSADILPTAVQVATQDWTRAEMAGLFYARRTPLDRPNSPCPSSITRPRNPCQLEPHSRNSNHTFEDPHIGVAEELWPRPSK